MPIDILIVSSDKKKTKEIYRFLEVEENQLNNEEWKEASSRITEEARQNNFAIFEIFLCIRGDLLISDFDFGFLETVLEMVINNLWGAKVYLIVDRNIEQTSGHHLKIVFNLALKYRVLDIFEVGTEDEIFLRDLRYEADMFQISSLISKLKESRVISLDLISKSGWDCMIPKKSIPPEEHLIPFGKNENNLVNDSRLLIYCEGDENYAKGFVNKNIAKYKTRSCLIANINYCFDEKTKADYLEQDIKTIDFIGNVDLNYYLRKLNQRRRLLDQSETLRQVNLLEEPHFKPFQIQLSPKVLIVNTFLPSEEFFQDLAKEVGRLKKIVEPDAEVEVYPAIDFSQLPDIIENNPLTVWVFQGHGNDNKIKDISGNYQTPEELLRRFVKYNDKFKAGLTLVLFASCKSASFAEAFAAHGVGVAIGFKENVTCFETSVIAEYVVPAAIRNKDSSVLVDEILKAFQQAMNTLVSRNLECVKPIAFYTHR